VEGATTTNKFFANQFQKAATAASTLHGPLNGISGRLSALATTFRIAGVAAVGFGTAVGGMSIGLTKGFRAAVETEHQMARLEGVLNATGGAAGFTAEQIDEMARNIAMSTLASTEGVRDAAAALATFSTISGDAYERTLNVAQDVAEVMGTDIKGATLQLAKALDAPLLGMNSLRRAGVSFTAQQREQIKVLEESGDLFAQQELILAAVEAQLGGTAAAAADGTFVGAMDTLGQSVQEFFERVVKTSGAVEKFTGWINSLSESIQRQTREMDLSSNSIHTLLGEYRVMTEQIEEQQKRVQEAGFGTRWAQQKTLDEMLAKRAAHKEAIDELIKKEKEAQDAADAGAAAAADALAENKAAALAKIGEEAQKLIDKVQGQIAASETREAGSDDDPRVKADAQYEQRIAAMERMKQANMEYYQSSSELQRVFNELEIQLKEEHEAKLTEIEETEREERAKKWIKWADERRKEEEEIQKEKERNLSMMEAAAESSMRTTASLLKEGSKAQKVALIAEQAIAIPRMAMKFNEALMNALASGPWPANMAAYAQVASLGAGLLSNMANMTKVSGRALGGTVVPGGRYMVGEHGPEILQMGTGSGHVVKNEDISPNVNVSIVENAERAGTVQQEGMDIEVYVAAAMTRLNNDLNSGRGLFAAVENRYGLQR
jgi:hypothetical protein